MKAVIIGATGATGKELLDLLIDENTVTEVVALVRKSLSVRHPKLKEIIVDFDTIEKWTESINGDIAFSCLGTTLKMAGSKEAQYKVDYHYQYEFAKIAKSNNIPTFVLISSSTANAKSFMYYSKMKGELEDIVETLNFESFIIFRPGPLVRSNSDRIGEKIGVSVISGLNKIGLFRNMAPLNVKNLAKLMLQYAIKPPKGKTVLESGRILTEIK